MADCITPAVLSDIARKDTQRLIGTIARALAANSPFINILGGGTFPSGVSDEVRTSVQMQAAPGDSLALPTFVCDTDLCGTVGLQDLTDAIDFTSRLEGKRGFGPRVCVKKGYAAFKSSYLASEDSLRKLITQYINADVRAQLYLRSASKFVAAAGYCFEALFTGGSECDVGVKFAPILPTAPITFKTLHYIARYLKEVLFGEMFPAGGFGPTGGSTGGSTGGQMGGSGMMNFRFIGSSDIIESFRNEVGVQNVLCCLTTGGYRLGEIALTAYSFETSPAYRGLAFGVDQRPLRASGFTTGGCLNLIDPVITVVNACKNTAYAKVNPAWLEAEFEVGFLIAEGSFNRLVPERYVGEGSFKFAPQLHMGELDWHYEIDNDCNVFGDFGWHKFQITRAYQPLRPQHIIPILYRRCPADLGLIPCDPTVCSGFSGADSFATLNECTAECPLVPCHDSTPCGALTSLVSDDDAVGGGSGAPPDFGPAGEGPDLGLAEGFGLLAGSTITNVGFTTDSCDLGLSPGTSVTGFPPGIVLGAQHITDGAAAQAQLDLTAAYIDLAGRPPGTVVAGNIGGQTLSPGIYTAATSLAVSSGDLTLDAGGNVDAVFIFQIGSTLTLTPGRQVILTGGAQARNIFWQVGSSATLDTTSVLYGSILALTSITANAGAVVNGRLLARNGAIDLDDTTVLCPPVS